MAGIVDDEDRDHLFSDLGTLLGRQGRSLRGKR